MSKIRDSIRRAGTLYRNHIWWGRFILAAVLLLLVLVVVRVSLPHTIIYSSVYWLGKQGINAQIEDIFIDVDKGTFTIFGASGIKNGERVFNIGKAAIDWEWRPLAAKTVHIKGIELEDFGLVAEQYTDGLVIAGVVIRPGEGVEPPPAKDDDKVAWGASLDRIDFRDLGFCFKQFNTTIDAGTPGHNVIDYCGGLDSLKLAGDFSLDNEESAEDGGAQKLSVDGRIQIEQLKLHNNKLENALVSIAAISLPVIKINGIDDIKLDRLEISGLAVLQNAGHPKHAHAVEFNSLDVSGIALSNTDTLAIDTISLEKPIMSMAADESGAYGYEPWLPPQPPAPADQAAASEQQAAEPKPFNLRLGDISITDPELCYRQAAAPSGDEAAELDYCLNLAVAEWRGGIAVSTPSGSQPLQLALDGDLALAKLAAANNVLERDLVSFEEISVEKLAARSTDDIRLDRFGVTGLAVLQNAGHPKHAHAVQFSSLDVSGIALSNTDTLAIDTITIEKPLISMAMDASGAYGYEPWLLPQPPAPADQTAAPEQQAAEPKPFNLRLGGISVTNSELCYRQAAAPSGGQRPELDYCLNLAGTRWNGGIAVTTPSGSQPLQLALDGDLALVKLVAANNVLERDLVSFEKLDVNKIAVKGIDDLGFKALKLRNLAGLELGAADNTHTLTVAGVDLAVLSYRKNSLSIDTAAVSDLGLAITLNEDGALDYEQWLVDTAAPEDEQAAGDAAGKGADSDPMTVRIGEFKLDSTRQIQFADRSVTPNMVVGLGELHFDVSKLDSSKPQQDSPLSLSAKTMRHGTIEIKGMARPFEAKPSFDATGKVTGIDLRVASPRVEQAVGHIIKSGQLDADLKLLAQQGVLDSEISLVLHQFNLKARSKDAAAALDDKFGMPINQSLVLLKDKKGRIKLDIPITGDINDPSFDPTDAIIKATTKATAVTLVTFYTPYGLAFAGGNILLNLAKALNFDPLVFEPGSAALTDAHREQLSKLAEMLVERPAVYLTLCGYTNLDDRSKVTTEIIDKSKIKPPTAESLQKLKQLGNERTDKVKDHLVSAGKIAHDRLILCEPEHSDDAEAISGVEISI